ncbi:MAG: nickel-dependent lactate racemase [SAR324 cluster bacterium]|nr:nickel-dependent lactate racemase [SAR324 cluster bacterium]
MHHRTISMAYGRNGYALDLPADLAQWDLFNPQDHPPLADPAGALEKAFLQPIGARPLREIVAPDERVVVVTSDNTRPVPNRELIPALVKHLGLTAERLTILVGGGSHKANTRQEWLEMFGEEIVEAFPIFNHDAYDPGELVEIGRTDAGGKALLNTRWVHADKRIVLGFIEPHFFAGFSGGSKGVMPALAGIETILHFHRAAIIGDPRTTWGVMAGNPQQELSREVTAMAPPDFLVNVTLSLSKQITGVYCGHYLDAQAAGVEQARREAMAPATRSYPLVVTTNSGYPLDQNLYQTVKGMSAAAKIVQEGGSILTLSECAKGIPDHGHFAELMTIEPNPRALLERIEAPDFSALDQWQAQTLALILLKARVFLHSTLQPDAVRRCQIEPVDSVEGFLSEYCESYRRRHGEPPVVAVLPHGPLTIPYLDSGDPPVQSSAETAARSDIGTAPPS